ncbi:MAG: trehalose-phosphatase [Ancalomicrobiaceae bacterium]|nr:trehalose-phosphatase [Ancalomicrobiaceae bacterium]
MPSAEAITLTLPDGSETDGPSVGHSSLAEPCRAENPERDWALFLDIDGTLLRLVPDPRDAIVDDDLRRLLAAATARLDGAIAFISGRRLAVIREMLGPLAVHAAGLYGLEFLSDGVEFATPIEVPMALADLADQVERLFAGEPGLVIERKGPVLSLNTGKRADLLSTILPLAERTLERLPAGYRNVIGHAGLELMPVAADKGSAIRRFMTMPPFQSRRPIFIGDDKPDERGFAAINASGGISVRVFPAGETQAHYGVEDVDAVRQWLGGENFPDVTAFTRLTASPNTVPQPVHLPV